MAEKLCTAAKDWGAVVLALGGAAIAAIEWLATLAGWISAPSAFWMSLGIVLFLGFGSGQIIRSKVVERRLNAGLPRISFSRSYVDERVVLIPPPYNPTYSSQTGSHPTPGTILPSEFVPPGFDRQEKYYFAHITFKNDSMAGVARNVSAEYAFYDAVFHRIPIFNFFGRWGLEKEQLRARDFRTPPKNQLRIDILPTGEEFELDIAMKHRTEGFAFAFSDPSYSSLEFRKREYILEYDRIFICVKLRGERLALSPFWFELHNLGKGNSMTIQPCARPKQLLLEKGVLS